VSGGTRPSFRATAAQRLREDGGALPPAVEEFLSDTRRMAVRLLPLRLVALHPSRADESPADAGLASLVESVRQFGVLEPILVRPVDDGRFEVVAGERRLRAARLADQETIPAVVREMDEATASVLTSPRVPETPVAPVAPEPVAVMAVEPVEPPAPDPVRVVDPRGMRGADPVRHNEPWRIGDAPRLRRSTNGTYMPPAVVTRREPIVISGPGIPGPGGRRDPEPVEPAQRAAGDDADRRSRFRLGGFSFLRRARNGSGER
jgi:hypothetical protein